ncbi:hypothetical protein PUN28_019547 [Cardiocondyla obscurior]|uniref:Uncharacterized protein n=1 Tax=Cardiocondyla obscurior TaxID=286306 RepID=A0AAW2ECV1_9HYME
MKKICYFDKYNIANKKRITKRIELFAKLTFFLFHTRRFILFVNNFSFSFIFFNTWFTSCSFPSVTRTIIWPSRLRPVLPIL